MQDKELLCECGEYFIFTSGEQEYYKMKGLTEPKRCFECRKKKRADKEREEQARSLARTRHFPKRY